jgi:hypothetical protein
VPLALLILLAPLSPMLLIKVFGWPPFIYPKKCHYQKIHVKFIILEYEMNFIKMMKNMAFKKIKSKFHILMKFQCILFLHSSFDGDLNFLIFWHYYDILFESTFFILFAWQKEWHHFKSPLGVHCFLRIHLYFKIWFLLNFIATWIIKNLIMLILSMALHFKFNYNLEKLWL